MMKDQNQTTQKNNWTCPCNGCKKSRLQALQKVLEILDGGGDAYSRIENVRKLIGLEKTNKK